MEDTNQIEFLLSLIGVIFLLFGSVFHYRYQQLLKNGIPTTGTVVDLVKSSNTRDNPALGAAYYPVVIFKTRSGQDIRQKMSFGRYPSPYSKGDKVDILYSSKKPSKCMIASEKGGLKVSKLFVIIGCAILLVSILFYVDVF
jgi:hypothetical protein